jgi:hypothetical protein
MNPTPPLPERPPPLEYSPIRPPRPRVLPGIVALLAAIVAFLVALLLALFAFRMGSTRPLIVLLLLVAGFLSTSVILLRIAINAFRGNEPQ